MSRSSNRLIKVRGGNKPCDRRGGEEFIVGYWCASAVPRACVVVVARRLRALLVHGRRRCGHVAVAIDRAVRLERTPRPQQLAVGRGGSGRGAGRRAAE
eukprot:4932351-Pleurochrysis_carterae.AAC.10